MHYTTDRLPLRMYLDYAANVAKQKGNVKVSVGSTESYESELTPIALDALSMLYQIRGQRTPAELLRFTGLADEIAKKVNNSHVAQVRGLHALADSISAVQQTAIHKIVNGLEELCDVGLVGRVVKCEGRYVAYVINHGRFVNSYVVN